VTEPEALGRRDALLQAGMTLAAELEPDVVLQRIVELATALTGARYGALGVIGPGGEELVEFVTTGVTPDQRAAIGHPPVGRGILGVLIHDARPLRLPEISKDPRSFGFPPNHPPMRSFLGAPVKARGRMFGNIYLTEKQDADEFTVEDEQTIEVLAAQAGVAIENARLHAEVERLAVLEDRERIAKELHDGVIQALFAVGMGLQGTAALSRDPELERRIEAAVGEIDGAIRDLRNYIFGLRPGILADRQLDQALRTLAEEFEQRTGVTTVVDVDPRVAAELSSKAADVVQFAREALSNVGRHAEAATCRLSLTFRDGGAVLEVDDDGHGFDPEGGRGGGQGLRNLEARATSLGGTVLVTSAAGEGTSVRVVLPLS
jgi:signal transduction histidine kinase